MADLEFIMMSMAVSFKNEKKRFFQLKSGMILVYDAVTF